MDSSTLELTVGMLTVPRYSVYDGQVNLSHGGQSFTGQYQERLELSLGIQATAAWKSDVLGDMSLGLFGTLGDSDAVYNGIGGEESRSRGIVTVGFDVGLRPALAEGPWGSMRIPFGPSLLWQKLDLSSGHRDIYGDPDALGDPPSVDWSDRSWVSFGGYGGVAFEFAVIPSLGLQVETIGRFIFADNGGWAGQEEEDIVESTGNAVNISYEKLVVFFVTTKVGFSWRP